MRALLGVVSVSLLLLLPAAGCKAKQSEPSGVGNYEFGKTKLGDVEKNARCLTNDDYQECVAIESIKIGAQPGQTQLIFKAKPGEKDAPLVEIALTIRACQIEEAAKAMVTVLGKPDEGAPPKHMFWTKKLMFVSAKLPAKNSASCEINFVDVKDAERIKGLQGDE